MSMVVRTNTMAMNANNALNKNNSTVAGNLQKLSSGFRINRAADDASGLAVSEKMKAQIKALDQATKNAQDGASLIKTAEGYMGEVHDMLNKIVELAEKSANGTFETVAGGAKNEFYGGAATDRQALQDEVDQLTTEIDRIATTANFNQLKLMDGSLETKNVTAYTSAQIADKFVKKEDGTGYEAATADNSLGKTLYAHTDAVEAQDGVPATYQAAQVDSSSFASLKASLYTDNTCSTKVADDAEFDASTTYYSKDNVATWTTPPVLAQPEKYTELSVVAAGDSTKVGAGLKLQIGETSSSADRLEVSIDSFKTADLFKGMTDVTVANASDAYKTASEDGKITGGLTINISNQDIASKAAEQVRNVINKVSSQRANLGAMENRLDYTINNLTTASENITDANSRIRDTDMAKTMMQYTQGNTLTQAAQAMLAQANQAPSQVLQLLQ